MEYYFPSTKKIPSTKKKKRKAKKKLFNTSD